MANFRLEVHLFSETFPNCQNLGLVLYIIGSYRTGQWVYWGLDNEMGWW